jgi:hypothetical protein
LKKHDEKMQREGIVFLSIAFATKAGYTVRDIEPSHEEMKYQAMNSYRLRSAVIKTDDGF